MSQSAQSALRAQRMLVRVGKQAADEQDRVDVAPKLDEERGLARFRDAVDTGIVVPKSPRRWLAASFVASLLFVVALIAWPRAALTFAMDHGPEMGVAQWIDSDARTTVRFSDGTQISAVVGSRFRISETTPVGATVQLERGELIANVKSLDSTRWLVDAGPFNIRVTGTEFVTSWDPVNEVFELQMLEGTVVLAGPVVGGQREVRAPEHLRIEVGRKNLSVVGPTQVTSEAVTSLARPSSPTAKVDDAPLEAEPKPRAVVAPPPKSPNWAELAKNGKYTEALALVRATGPASLVASESASRLLLLAQMARLAGDPALAAQALASLGSRFPNSVQAKTAQFLSGKLHFDRGRNAAAVAELSAYLNAAPGGAFAGEAQVLLIIALHRAGRGAEARAMARPYLERHPDSPHAARIRSIVSP